MYNSIASLIAPAASLAVTIAALAQAPELPASTAPPAPTGNGSPAASSAVSSAAPTAHGTPYPSGEQANDDEYGAQRDRIWNSSEMLEARQYILEYSRRSVQFGPREAQAYLARLKKLSPSDMTAWLQRFNARRAQIARGTAVAKMAREQSVSQALQRIEGARQAFDSIKQGQTQAAETSRGRVQATHDLAGESRAAMQSGRQTTLQDMFIVRFNPFDPTLDPVAGSYYFRRAGAAATLPGDLVDANGNNIVGTDADIAAATPEGAAGYAGGNVPGTGGVPGGGGGGSR